MTALVIHNDLSTRQALRNILSGAGFAVVAAQNGEEGCRHALEGMPDVILLDMALPVMNGLDTCRKLRSLPQFTRTPIIMLCAPADQEILVGLFQAGADDYLPSSFEGQELIARIHGNLFKKREIRVKERELTETKAALEKTHERLKQMDRVRAEFLNTATHELRIPVTIVNGYCTLLRDMGTENFTVQQNEFLEEAIKSSERLVDLINSMLDLSRLEAGKMIMDIEPRDISAVLDEVSRGFRHMAAASGLEIEVDSRSSCLAVFDDEKVHQVLANLVGNAIKFTPSGGRIHIALREGDESIVVSVEDTGKGIPENRISELFEEFAQLGREDSRKGTGLGLAICKKIIESHQGRIWAESVPGEGSRFSFSLPKPS
jgi:signal transduction histidine kinase